MDWEGVLSAESGEIEQDEQLLEALFSFLLRHNVSRDSELVRDADSVVKILAVMRTVLKVKGTEAQTYLEELSRAPPPSSGDQGASERDLLDQIVHLEKEIRSRDATISNLRERGVASTGNEARFLREENEDLKKEVSEVRRTLSHERSENERLTSDASAERLKSRQLEREVDQLRQNLEDYRRQLDWQSKERGGASSLSRAGESDFREKLRKKDLEIAEQLDKIEELLNARDSLEKQLHELTVQLGQVEEQRIKALRDMENMRAALVETDSRSDDLEKRNHLLEGEVADLRQNLKEQSQADEHIMALMNTKTKEWQSLLSAKESELQECQGRLAQLEEQLRAAQTGADRATIVKMKQQLQERDAQLSSLQGELSEAAGNLETLTSQLHHTRQKADPLLVNPQLYQEVEQLKTKVQSLEEELGQETRRREEAELQKEEKDVELAQALGRLGEYERGEYGLHEAVQEIKMKKEEIAVRDRDIAELTQRVNVFESELNQLAEENEALRDRVGVGEREQVDVTPLRSRRAAELERLRETNRRLEREVEHLEEEKLNMRKQLLEQAMNRGQRETKRGRTSEHSSVVPREMGEEGGGEGGKGNMSPLTQEQNMRIQQLKAQVTELQGVCTSERRRGEQCRQEVSRLTAQLREKTELVGQYEVALREVAGRRGEGGGGEEVKGKRDALERLVAMLEARSTDGKYDLTLQLKTEVSELSGQAAELRQQVQRSETELREALRMVERKQFEVETLQKEVQHLRKASSGFQPLSLPEGLPMTSNDVIGSLNEHLLRVLKELKSREQTLLETQKDLERYQRKFAVIIHQQGIVYKEYRDGCERWEAEKKKLVEEKREVDARHEQDQIRVQELKRLHETLAADPDNQRQRIGELSRKVTILQVNEKALSRRYSLLLEAEDTLRKENRQLHKDLVTMETAITERMGYLERHKEASQFKLSAVQHQLSGSVPASLLEKANNQYSELVSRHQELLRRQTSHSSVASTIEHLQGEVRTLSDQLESVKQELTLEKQKCRLLEQNASSANQSEALGKKNSDGEGETGRVLAERLVTLEMRELNERQRADLAVTRYRQTREALSHLEERNAELEERVSELSRKLLESQAKEGELSDRLAGCLTLADKESLETRVQELKTSETKLKLENAQLKEVAEVARQQSVAMEMWQKSRDLEMSSLRHQLLDLQMQSDEKTVAGKLHHQIVTLEISEATALKKVEEANSKVMRLEASLLRCEQQRDELSSAVFHVRAESQGKIRHLRETVQALRRQNAGALPLSEQEKHAELVRKVQEERKEVERMKKAARKEKEEMEEKLLQLETQHGNLQELMASLRDTKSAAAKLTEWHAKLGEMRLQEMKLNRAVERERERVRHLEGLVERSEKAFAKLEQDLVQVTKDYEEAQLGWEQRELELEQQLDQLKQQQGRMASAANRMERAAGNIPDPHLPVATQLEQAIRSLGESEHAISGLKQRTKRAEEHADKMEKALNKAQTELLRRDREMAELRLEISAAQRHSFLESPDSRGERGDRSGGASLKVAQETIEQLKALVDQKESLVDKYQRLLQAARQELQTTTESHKQEVASLMSKLRSKTDSTFSKLKEAALDAVNVPQVELPTDKQLARLQELEDLVVEQETANAALSQEVSEVRREMLQSRQTSEGQLAALRKEMEDLRRAHHVEVEGLHGVIEERSSRATELEQEVEVLEGELSAAQEALRRAPSRTMRSLVERLRNQLAIKEKQHKALSEALLQVRADLVETTQKTLEGRARQEQQDANVQQLVDKKTSELQARINSLSGHMDKLKQQLEEACEREEEKGAEVRQLEGEMRQLQRALEQAETRERTLTQEVTGLRQQLEQNSEVVELQRRVTDLQEKLREQKQRMKEHEEALRGAGGAGKSGETSVEASAQIDSKHHSAEVLKWEESKRWQKRLEGLRTKLTEKNKELEAAQRQIKALKETLARADREKSILQGKLRSAQKTINEGTHTTQQPASAGTTASPSGGSLAAAADEQHRLKSRIFELENEVCQLEREIKTEKSSECHELKMRNSQLLRTVETLETQLQQQHPGSSGQLYAMREHERRLQDDILQCQKENMQLRFEYEQARLELPRLKTRIEDQQQYIEVLKNSAASDGNVRVTTKKDSAVGGRSVAEMERVVAAMRKVVERLQSENESLRKSAAKPRGTGMAQLEAENKKLKSELEKLRTSIPTTTGETLTSKSPYAKIVAENERLRKDLKREIDKNEKLQLSLSTLEVQNSKLQQEMQEISSHSHHYSKEEGHSGWEERVEILQEEVEKKNRMLLEVKKHLREAAEREKQLKTISHDSQLTERYLTILQERDALQQQVSQLKKELDAFDPAFFEEIEDLKYNYQEAVKKNIQYEEQLTALAKQFGVSVPGLEIS